MAINMITGYTGEPHVTSAQAGIGHAGMYGTDRYVLDVLEGLEYELISNNLIRIKSGMVLNQGRFMGIDHNDYVDIEIDNGQNDKKRCDLIVCTYSKNVENGVESVELKNIKGTSGDDYIIPEYTKGNIINNDSVDDFPLYKIKINGLNVESVEKVFSLSSNMKGIEDNVTSLTTRVTSLEDKTQPVLFEGSIKSGVITLNESIYNYKFLVFLIKAPDSVNGFGYGLFPVIRPENHGQSEPLIMADPTAEHYHSTYIGKFSYGAQGKTLTFEDPITNVTHEYGKNHGGATTYSVSKIIGIR